LLDFKADVFARIIHKSQNMPPAFFCCYVSLRIAARSIVKNLVLLATYFHLILQYLFTLHPIGECFPGQNWLQNCN